ncbi:MAG TPA: TetR/AcrR family transcriptional regulator C-terminal domain-containing protein [Kofleriaceae bacterium]|jgi:AcrR family transcriptional regulator
MSRRSPKPPIWTQPAPGSRRPKLTRDQIAQLAVAIADAEGIEAVSMRRLSEELGVATMTLYYYVRTKEDLVSLMSDAIMGEMVVDDDDLHAGDWRGGLATIARRGRAVMLRHPWALTSLQGARMGPHGLAHVEQSLQVMHGGPFDIAANVAINTIIDDYVHGHVQRSIEGFPVTDAAAHQTINEFTAAQLESGRYPRLSALLAGDEPVVAMARISRWITDDERFEVGLVALIDGLAAHFATHDKKAAWTRKAPPRKPR